jgi:hypothetical protein
MLAVLPDGPVRREFAHARQVKYGHAFLIPEDVAYLILPVHIRTIVGQEQVFVLA